MRFICRAEVLDKTGLSFTRIWQLMREGAFPRGRAVGSRTLWLESEVDDWITQQPIRQLKGDPDGDGRERFVPHGAA